MRTVWRVDLRDGDYCVVTTDGRHETHVGPDDFARQWGEWYVSTRNMPDDTAPWILDGLRTFSSLDGDAHLFVYNGEPVGTMGWNGMEWWFYGLTWDLQSTEGEPVHIDVDAEQRAAFTEQREFCAAMPEGAARDTAFAELAGRTKLHRDETRDLAMTRAKLEARRTHRRRHR